MANGLICHRFASAEDVKCHTATDVVMAVGTKNAIPSESHKVEVEEDKLTKRRCQLFSSKNIMLCLKANELGYYGNSLKTLNDIKSLLIQLESQVQSVTRKTEHNFSTTFNKQRGKMQRTRRMENGKKSEKRKEMRLYQSCASVLTSITLHGLSSDAAAKGNFGFKIDHTSINPYALDALKPKMHLRGLKHLIDKGVFVDDGSDKIAAEVCKHFQEQLASTMEANKVKKARKMKKPRYGTIEKCFQKAKVKITDDSNITDNDESSESSSESSE